MPITNAKLDYLMTEFGWLSDTIWGKIRWPKSIGRPLGPTLASAFLIQHIHWQSVKEGTPEGVRYIDLVVPHPEPSKWDGPVDEYYYQVSYMVITPPLPTRVRVGLVEHIQWEHIQGVSVAGRGYRDIDPSEKRFIKGDNLSVLDPFEIVIKPFSDLLRT